MCSSAVGVGSDTNVFPIDGSGIVSVLPQVQSLLTNSTSDVCDHVVTTGNGALTVRTGHFSIQRNWRSF